MASTFTTVQFMDPPGGPGVTGAVKAGSGISISADGTISTVQGGGIVKTITGTNGIVTTGTTDVIVSLNPPTTATIGGVRTVEGSGISIDSQGVIRSVAQYNIQPGVGISVTNVTPISSTVSVNPAGTTVSTRGGVWLDIDSGLSLTSSGALSLVPATVNKLGGVKVGSGLTVDPDGTLNAQGTGGTITSVTAGAGLSGGGSTGGVTLSLLPPTATVIGGVKQGTGVTIGADGTISTTAPAIPTLQEVTDAGPTTTDLVTVAGLKSTDDINIEGALKINSGAATNAQLFQDGRAFIKGPVGIGETYDNEYTLTIGDRNTGGLRLLGDKSVIVLDNVGGVSSRIEFRTAGALTATLTDLGVGGASFLTNDAAADLTFGTGGVEYLKISGLNGQITLNSSTPEAFTLPVTKGTAGQVLQTNGAGSTVWADNTPAGALPLAGGTMTGLITFAAGQTFPTTVYAPLNTPTFTGPVTVNADGVSGSNALTVTGGNLVLGTSFTPANSSAPGSVGELAWDNSGYIYFCYLPNTWGRVQIDLTPF